MRTDGNDVQIAISRFGWHVGDQASLPEQHPHPEHPLPKSGVTPVVVERGNARILPSTRDPDSFVVRITVPGKPFLSVRNRRPLERLQPVPLAHLAKQPGTRVLDSFVVQTTVPGKPKRFILVPVLGGRHGWEPWFDM